MSDTEMFDIFNEEMIKSERIAGQTFMQKGYGTKPFIAGSLITRFKEET